MVVLKVAPVRFGLFDHAGNEVDVNLREPNAARVVVAANDLAAVMGAAVDFQNVIVEILHAQAQARDAQLANGLELGIGQRARLGFESDFFRFVPGQQRLHRFREVFELVHGEVRGGAAAEIDEVRFPPADERLRGVERKFLDRGVDVAANGGRVLVGINPEITEVAPLPAERDVQINPERRARLGRPFQRGVQFPDPFRFPKGKRRII